MHLELAAVHAYIALALFFAALVFLLSLTLLMDREVIGLERKIFLKLAFYM